MRAHEFITEKWNKKYKKSINCSSPKGFSQKAHCAGREKNEDVAEGLTTEKQILTRIRQIMYDRKLSGTESNAGELLRLKQQLKDLRSQQGVAEDLDEDLRKWFKDKWVRFGPDGKIRGDCARGSEKEGKPKCLPRSKAHALGKKGRATAAARKRREDPNPNRSGKAINVKTK